MVAKVMIDITLCIMNYQEQCYSNYYKPCELYDIYFLLLNFCKLYKVF